MQQINLYRRDGASSNGSLLKATTVLLTIGLLMLTLAGISVFGHWRLKGLEHELDALRARQAEEFARLERANAHMAGRTAAQIEQHIKTLTASVTRGDGALQALASGAAGSPQGFATRLEALARGHIEGLWLERMALASRDRALALHGSAVDADLVPRYLEGLAREPTLSGTRFGHLNIERKPEHAAVRFEVATDMPAADTEGGS